MVGTQRLLWDTAMSAQTQRATGHTLRAPHLAVRAADEGGSDGFGGGLASNTNAAAEEAPADGAGQDAHADGDLTAKAPLSLYK